MNVEQIRKDYPIGTRVLLIHMDKDPFPVPDNTMGTVTLVDDMGHIHVSWDCHSSLALIPNKDQFKKVN